MTIIAQLLISYTTVYFMQNYDGRSLVDDGFIAPQQLLFSYTTAYIPTQYYYSDGNQNQNNFFIQIT